MYSKVFDAQGRKTNALAAGHVEETQHNLETTTRVALDKQTKTQQPCHRILIQDRDKIGEPSMSVEGRWEESPPSPRQRVGLTWPRQRVWCPLRRSEYWMDGCGFVASHCWEYSNSIDSTSFLFHSQIRCRWQQIGSQRNSVVGQEIGRSR